MKLKAILSFIFNLLLFNFSSFAQMTPEEAVQAMGRGINLGNTLDAPHEGDWALKAEEYYFDAYKNAGFSSVRIPITWNNHASNTSPYTIDPEFMDRVEEVVDWALERELIVIINCHHEGWLKENYTADNIARFESLWTQISDRFYQKSENLLFEPLNEPRTLAKSLTISQAGDANQRALNIIREKNPSRNVIISGTGWSAIADLLVGVFPENDEYIIGYFHTYDPWEFSSGGSIKTWGSANDKKVIADEFQKVKEWTDRTGIPAILSEFGSIHQTDFNSRMRHYATFVEQSLKRGISFMAWDDGGDFEIYKRAERKWHLTKDILIHYSELTADNVQLSLENDSTVLLSWNNRSQSEELIYIEKMIEGEFVVIDSVSNNIESYQDSNLITGNKYVYRVSQSVNDSLTISYPQRINLIHSTRSNYEGELIQIPGVVEAENYDIGGDGFTFSDNDEGNQGGAYREDDVDIEAREDGGYHIGYLEVGEWLEYSVSVEKDGYYNVTALVAAQEAGGEFSIISSLTGSSLKLQALSTSSWEATTEVEGVINLTAGEQILKIKIEKLPSFNIDKITFSISDTPPLSVDNDLVVSKLSIAPNPSSDKILIKKEQLATVNEEVQILNAIGNLVLKFNLDAEEKFIDLEHLPNGMYFVKYMINGRRMCSKIIKN